MSRTERAALGGLVAFSILAFLPVFRDASLLGVALFGWMMAALLLGSPAILLLLVLKDPAPTEDDPPEAAAPSPDP